MGRWERRGLRPILAPKRPFVRNGSAVPRAHLLPVGYDRAAVSVHISVSAEAHHSLATIVEHMDGYWRELGIGSELVRTRRRRVFEIRSGKWALLPVAGELTLHPQSARVTLIDIDGVLGTRLPIPGILVNRIIHFLLPGALRGFAEYLRDHGVDDEVA